MWKTLRNLVQRSRYQSSTNGPAQRKYVFKKRVSSILETDQILPPGSAHQSRCKCASKASQTRRLAVSFNSSTSKTCLRGHICHDAQEYCLYMTIIIPPSPTARLLSFLCQLVLPTFERICNILRTKQMSKQQRWQRFPEVSHDIERTRLVGTDCITTDEAALLSMLPKIQRRTDC